MRNKNQLRLCSALAAFSLAQFVGCGMAAAQDGTNAVDDEAAGHATDIVVTAQRRSQSVQEVPAAITAFGTDALAARQINNLESLRGLAPSLVMDPVPGGSSSAKVSIRGVGTDDPVFSRDSAVGIYIDDVFIARAQGIFVDLYDLERIEVLRGPQGTLYGRNSSVGAIKLVTAKPDLDESFAKGEVGYGNYNAINAVAVVNAAIRPGVLGLRIAASYSDHDGYQTNALDGSKAYTGGGFSTRAHLLWAPTNEFEMLLSGSVLREDAVPAAAVDFSADPKPDVFVYKSANLDLYQTTDAEQLTLNMVWKRDALSLRSITAYRETDWAVRNDVDGLADNLFEGNQALNQKQFSQELIFNAEAGVANILTGAYYFKEKQDFLWDVTVAAPFIPQGFQLFNQDTDAFAVFADVTLKLADRLTIAGGLRYSWERKDFAVEGFVEDGFVMPQRGGLPRAAADDFSFADRLTFDDVTWRASIDWRATDDVMVYGSIATGLRSGGFNGGARSLAEVQTPPFRPENVRTYEVGLKSTMLDGAVTANFAAFYSDFSNLQEAVLQGTAEFGVATPNATIRGIEFDGRIEPIKDLVFTLTASHLATRIKNTDYRGNRLRNSPSFQGSLGIDYRTQLAGGVFGVNLTGSYSTKYFLGIDNMPAEEARPYFNMDGGISYALPDSDWKISFAMRNITDKHRATHTFNLPGFVQVVYPNTPRTYMATLSYRM